LAEGAYLAVDPFDRRSSGGSVGLANELDTERLGGAAWVGDPSVCAVW